MLQELMINTTVQMLLLALAAGVFLGGAVVGTSVAVVRHRTRPVPRWVPASSGAALLVAVALAALVVYVGTTSSYVTTLS